MSTSHSGMTNIPLRVRQGIRDYVKADDAPLNQKTADVASTLGYAVLLDPEWGMLFTTLQPYFPDQSTFIPSMANMLIVWFDAFTTWLESDDNAESVERMLTALKGIQVLKLLLEVNFSTSTNPLVTSSLLNKIYQVQPTISRPTSVWSTKKGAFVIALPKAQPSSSSTILAGFTTDMTRVFTASPSTRPVISPLLSGEPAPPLPEDSEAWADLMLESPEAKPVVRAAKDYDLLPDVATLARPEELLKLPPYWLIVRQEGKMRLEVQCSHERSLLVLEAYLKRWVRHATDSFNKPPVVEIKLRESLFGLGLLYDTLVLEVGRGREIGPPLVLTFVENVLGYDPVRSSSSAGCVWEFRRTTGFK